MGAYSSVYIVFFSVVILMFGGLSMTFYYHARKYREKIKQTDKYKNEKEIESLNRNLSVMVSEIEKLNKVYNDIKTKNEVIEAGIQRIREKCIKGHQICTLLEYVGAEKSDELRKRIIKTTNAEFSSLEDKSSANSL